MMKTCLTLLVLTILAAAPAAAQAPKTATAPKKVVALPRSSAALPFTGDFDQMVKRRVIRAAVAYNKTNYFIDRGVPRGLAYESLRSFESEINKRIKKPAGQVHVVFIPMSRDGMIPALLAGKVDVVVAQLTVTPERQALVDFSNPTRANVNEIVITGPKH